jgi:ComF family protein
MPSGTSLRRIAADALLSALVAPGCAACRLPLDTPTQGPVCEACWTRVRPFSPPLCLTCGDALPSWRAISVSLARCPICRRRPGAVDAGRSAGEYDGALRDIIHAFKYEGRRSLAIPLGHLMKDAGADLLTGAACVVPVPLHPWRRLRRGFNQASDLASRLDLPVVHALWRTRATLAQAGLSAAARRRNVRDALRMSPLLGQSVRRSLISGRAVVLVDDVRTTGATLDACARVLKQAGAREVRALTAARTPRHLTAAAR